MISIVLLLPFFQQFLLYALYNVVVVIVVVENKFQFISIQFSITKPYLNVQAN